jgi:5-formyltetrahydrofolate cyclo-ligase
LKNSLRKIALQNRRKIISPDAPLRLMQNFMKQVQLPENAVIAAYMPTKSELDIGFLCAALADAGRMLCLPIIGAGAQEMSFHEYKIGDELVANKFNILEPLPSAKPVQPNVVLVPMLAFDRSKNRLGYGGGYYDKFLQNSDALKIGIAYAAQEMHDPPGVPAGPLDARLPRVATEKGVVVCEGAP